MELVWASVSNHLPWKSLIVLHFKTLLMKHAGGIGQEASSHNLDYYIYSFSDLTTELLQYWHEVCIDSLGQDAA